MEKWEVVKLYIELQINEKDNRSLLESNQMLREDRKRMSDLFERQSVLVENQEAFINELQASKKAKQEAFDILQRSMVPSDN